MTSFWKYKAYADIRGVSPSQGSGGASYRQGIWPRPYLFCSGPTSGPTTRPLEAKKVKLK